MTITAEKPNRLLDTLREIYAGEGVRLGLLVFDMLTVLVFLTLTFLPAAPWMAVVDAVIGTLMLTELIIRTYIAHNRLRFLARPGSLVDIGVIATLLVPPLTGSFAFLRLLRAVRLFRALRVVRALKRRQRWVCEHGEVISSAVNLTIFVFITSAVVYEFQIGRNPQIRTFVDALYFTVTTLTTTGFGDITLTGESGRLLSVLIMIVGISLFVKLAQSIVRPNKVHVECQSCGLARHDPDAVHCKHCGTVVHIDNEGF